MIIKKHQITHFNKFRNTLQRTRKTKDLSKKIKIKMLQSVKKCTAQFMWTQGDYNDIVNTTNFQALHLYTLLQLITVCTNLYSQVSTQSKIIEKSIHSPAKTYRKMSRERKH